MANVYGSESVWKGSVSLQTPKHDELPHFEDTPNQTRSPHETMPRTEEEIQEDMERAAWYGNVRSLRRLLDDYAPSISAKAVALRKACFHSQVEAARLLIQYGANANETGTESPLDAVWDGHGSLEIIRLLVENGAQVNARDGRGRTVMHCNACLRRLDVVRYMIENGAEVDPKTHRGDTPLLTAFGLCKFETIEYLVENGADIHIRANDGFTAMHRACMDPELKKSEWMAFEKIDVFASDFDWKIPLDSQWRQDETLKKIKMLVENGVKINVQDDEGTTPFGIACSDRRFNAVQFLIESGADVNDGKTSPLMLACEQSYFEMAWLLMHHGANVNFADDDGKTPLHWACENNHLKIVQLLLHGGTKVNGLTKQGSTPLQAAAERNHADVVWLLVRYYPWLVLER